MNKILPIALAISIISGQLIKFPISGVAGPTLFDLTIIFLCAIGFLQIKGRFKKPNKVITSALIFSGVCLFSLIVSPLNLEFSERLNSSLYIARFFEFVLFYWIISSGGLESIKQNIINIFFYSSLALASLGLIQLIFYPNLMFLSSLGWDPHYARVVSTFLDPNFLGSFLIIGLILLLTKQINISPNLQKLFFVIIYITFVATFSRGSALMMLTSFLTLSLLLKSINIFKITLILSALFAFTFFAYTTLITTPRNIDRTQSASFRIDSWQQGLIIFKTYPIFGVGFNSYKYALDQLNLANQNYTESRGATTNDSSLIYVLSTTGIIGLISYSYLFWRLLYTSFKNFKNGSILSAVIFSSAIGLILQSFFSNTLFYPFFLLWIFLPMINLKSR